MILYSTFYSPCFTERKNSDQLLIIQCDSGHLAGDLIACARYRVLEERYKSVKRSQWASEPTEVPAISNKFCTHVLFIIHLPKQEVASSFVGFQGDLWVCTHIDSLLPPEDAFSVPLLQDMLGHSISELFYKPLDATLQTPHETVEDTAPHTDDDDVEHEFAEPLVLNKEHLQHNISERQAQNYFVRLHHCIHAAVSRIENTEWHGFSKNRAKLRVDILLRLIPKEPSGVLGKLISGIP